MLAYISLILTFVLTVLDYEALFKKDVKSKLEKNKFDKYLKSKSKLQAWVKLILLSTITIFTFIKQFKDDRVNATSGKMESLNLSNSLKNLDDGINYITVKLGSNYLNVSERELNSGTIIPLVVYNNSDPGSDNLTIRTFNGKIFINATARSFDNKIVAKVTNNEWQTPVRPEHYDRNYDDTGFEIIDGYGVIVLQVSTKNDTIKILGVNDRATCKDIILDDSTILYSVQEGINRYIELGKHIKPLFKYPSQNNLGIREL